MKRAVYSGTFDPITKGHISVVERAIHIFDEVVIAVAEDNYKQTLFTTDERVQLIEKSVCHMPQVSVDKFSGLLVEYAKKIGANAIIRGLRVISDFEYEMQMASFNKHLLPEIDTVFFTADQDFSYVSSSMIRSIAKVNGDIAYFVTPAVHDALVEKYKL